MFFYLLLGTRYLMPFQLSGRRFRGSRTRVAVSAVREPCYFE
jgi:MOSC domain-containing protein YiiM